MIDRILLFDFKNFSREALYLGPFTIIIGANGSGKSNIRDAFRFLHGIGRGYNLTEILGGKFGQGGQLEWLPIRGAPNEISRGDESGFILTVRIRIRGNLLSFDIHAGKLALRGEGFRVWNEQVNLGDELIYCWDNDGFKGLPENYSKLAKDTIGKDHVILTSSLSPYKGDSKKYIEEIIDTLSRVRFFDPDPNHIGQPSFPGQIVLGDSGENLPTVLKLLCENSAQKESIASWLRELTPMDVEDFEFPEDPAGRVHLVLKERNGRKVSAQAASGGTLRFLAMLAALMMPSPPHLYFFEEIENGIHPSRLRLLVDLIETQTAKGQMQVVATTHSPELLSIVNDETFKHTSVVFRQEGSSDAIIRPISEIPNAVELRKSQGLGRLLAGGWMETALAFTEDDEGGEETSG